MFRGSVPSDLRNIIGEHAAGWTGDAWVGCSGNFTIERVLQGLGGKLSLHSNDVQGYSSALGWYLAGRDPLPFTLREESAAALPWLSGFLREPIDVMATIMLGTRFLDLVGKSGRYYERQLNATRDQFPRMHAATVARLAGNPLRLASYHPMDVREWVTDVVPREEPVAMFPPFFAGDYESQFASIDKHFDWPAPTYPELDEAGKDELVQRVADRPNWVLGLHIRRPELEEHLRGMVQTANRGVPIYIYARSGSARIVRPRQAIEPIRMPKIGPDDELGDRMSLHVLNLGQFSMIRSQFMARSILPGTPALAVAVAIDGKIIGAFAFLPHNYEPNGAYLLSDFPVSWTRYRRLSKLIVMAALSREAQLLFQRAQSKRFTSLMTTAFSDRPNSAKYGRGIPGFKQTAHVAWRVGNVSVALGAILDVFDAHLTDLAEGYLDPEGEPSRQGIAPLEVVLGGRTVPVDAAAVITRAIDRMVKRGDVPAAQRWKALELWAADSLAGP